MHSEVATAAINIDGKKKRCTYEETRMIAVDEAHLTIQGVKHVNNELGTLHPERIVEAIRYTHIST